MEGKRVLLFTDCSQLKGGAEEQVYREQQYLEDLGNTVTSVGIGDRTADSFTDRVITDADSRAVREIAGLSVSLTVYRQLRSAITEFDPDVVHLHKSQKYPATVALATRGFPSLKTHHDYSTVCPSAWAVKQDTHEVCECGIGAKCWRHDCRSLPVVLGYYLPRHKVQKPIERRIIDRHIAPSARLTDHLTKFGYDAQQIRNPESVKTEADVTDDGFFFFIGRLSEEKGADVLMDAAEQLLAAGTDVDIKIAGSGPIEDTLCERANTNVEMLGYISEEEKQSLYRRARAIVVPSVWMENYPTVVLESMAYGKPVIGSERGGISEMIQHEQNGLLYPARRPEQLATHIDRLASDPGLAREMGESGRQWLRNHSNEEIFGRKMCALMEELSHS